MVQGTILGKAALVEAAFSSRRGITDWSMWDYEGE